MPTKRVPCPSRSPKSINNGIQVLEEILEQVNKAKMTERTELQTTKEDRIEDLSEACQKLKAIRCLFDSKEKRTCCFLGRDLDCEILMQKVVTVAHYITLQSNLGRATIKIRHLRKKLEEYSTEGIPKDNENQSLEEQPEIEIQEIEKPETFRESTSKDMMTDAGESPSKKRKLSTRLPSIQPELTAPETSSRRSKKSTYTSIKSVLDIYEDGKHYDSSKTFLDPEVVEKMAKDTGFPKPDINRWFQNKKYKEKYEEFVEQELERLWSQITRGVDFLKGLSISKSFSKIMAHKESQPYMKKFLDEKELRSDDFEYEFLIRRMTKLSRDEATHLVNVYRISEDKSFELFNEFAKRTSFSNMETRRFYVDVVKTFGSNSDQEEEEDVEKEEKEEEEQKKDVPGTSKLSESPVILPEDVQKRYKLPPVDPITHDHTYGPSASPKHGIYGVEKVNSNSLGDAFSQWEEEEPSTSGIVNSEDSRKKEEERLLEVKFRKTKLAMEVGMGSW